MGAFFEEVGPDLMLRCWIDFEARTLHHVSGCNCIRPDEAPLARAERIRAMEEGGYRTSSTDWILPWSQSTPTTLPSGSREIHSP